MTTLLTFVILTTPARIAPYPVSHPIVRHAVFSERIRSALGEAWRALIG